MKSLNFVAECPIGQYQPKKNVNKKCERCPNGQTTYSKEASSIRQCVCAEGYWNPTDHTRVPLNGKCAGKYTY